MIHLIDVTKAYLQAGATPVHALRGVSLDIHSGELVAILGPSGSGKSTLMNIMGLLDRPDSGRYELGGCNVAERSPDELAVLRNRTIGFVFQSFHLLPRATAVENVELPLIYSDRPNMRQRALAALERVGIADRASHLPGELSGGQQQRVAIARALVNEPAVIFADEPTGNLDSEAGAGIMALLRELYDAGRTIVVITHDADVAGQAGRQVRIVDGAIASDRSTPGGQAPAEPAAARTMEGA